MRLFVVTVLKLHHSYSVFPLKIFPSYRVCTVLSGFGKIKKGSWKFLEKIVVQPLTFEAAALAQNGGETAISSYCCF